MGEDAWLDKKSSEVGKLRCDAGLGQINSPGEANMSRQSRRERLPGVFAA